MTLRENCLYSELFWSVFSRIQSEYGEIWSIAFLMLMTMAKHKSKNLNMYYYKVMQNYVMFIWMFPSMHNNDPVLKNIHLQPIIYGL